MDMWKFFDITHREHILCNPMSLEKLEQLITLLPLKPGARVLEIWEHHTSFHEVMQLKLIGGWKELSGHGLNI